jgi:RNA polymerase sigma factor (sigma-70 family)
MLPRREGTLSWGAVATHELDTIAAAASFTGMTHKPSSRAAFPITAWTQLLSVQAGAPEAAAGLEGICTAYWPAIYTYLRALGCEREEARDHTQDFLSEFIRDGGLHRVAPERGRLRSYMMQAVRNHLANARRDAQRQKRGGAQIIISMDEMSSFDVPSQPEVADAWFDRRWACALLRRAMDRMAAHFIARGREALFDALKPGLANPEMLKPYSDIGASLGMTEGNVKLEMHRARKRLADELRAEVSTTLDVGGDVETELRYLLQVLGNE